MRRSACLPSGQIRLKEDVKGFRGLQQDRLKQTQAALDEEDPDWSRILVTLEIGQNQLTGRYREMSRDLAYLYDDYLFNRLDRTSAAAALLERAVLQRLERELSDTFDPELYRSLLELSEQGQIGEMDLMARLSTLLSLSLAISEELSPEAADFLAQGLTRTESGGIPDCVGASIEAQRRLIERLDELLVKMDEWEDYQELLQLFRDVIDTQHNLNVITREELRKNQ